MATASNWITTWHDVTSTGTYMEISNDRYFVADKDLVQGNITLDNTWEHDACRRGYLKVSAIDWLNRRVREICDCWKN